jgi:hypothetical protein
MNKLIAAPQHQIKYHIYLMFEVRYIIFLDLET